MHSLKPFLKQPKYNKSSIKLTTNISYNFSTNTFDPNTTFNPNLSNPSNNNLIQDLSTYATENIIKPKEIHHRPRFRNITIDGIDEQFDITKLSESPLFYTPKDFFFGRIFPVHSVQNFIDFLHDYMSYPMAIILFPFIIKATVTMPILIITKRVQQKIMPLMPTAMKEYRMGQRKYVDNKEKQKQFNAFIKKKYGFNPVAAGFRPLIGALIQMPIHISCFIGMKTMYSSYPDWKYSGILWFKDLSAMDPYWLLPISCGICMATGFYIATKIQGNDQFTMGMPKEVINIGVGMMAIIIIPISHYFSSGFNLYMSANTISYMVQTICIQNDLFRKFFGVKPVSYEQQYTRELREVNQEATKVHRQEYADSLDGKSVIMDRKERQRYERSKK